MGKAPFDWKSQGLTTLNHFCPSYIGDQFELQLRPSDSIHKQPGCSLSSESLLELKSRSLAATVGFEASCLVDRCHFSHMSRVHPQQRRRGCDIAHILWILSFSHWASQWGSGCIYHLGFRFQASHNRSSRKHRSQARQSKKRWYDNRSSLLWSQTSCWVTRSFWEHWENSSHHGRAGLWHWTRKCRLSRCLKI